MNNSSIVAHEPVPDSGDPKRFAEADDDFKKRGEILDKALREADRSLVVALDGPWGCGKSYFLRWWESDLREKEKEEEKRVGSPGVKVIYFDAFEKDYLDDPLVSLVHTVVDHVGDVPGLGKDLKEVAKKILPYLVKGTLYIAAPGVLPVLGEGGKIAEDADWWEVKTERERGMEQLRKALETALSGEDGPQKLFIIVDELDRCRPDYALRVLETIKHVFSVKNVRFVLGVNLEQLAHSVRAVYGLGISGEKYLQRFVDATMTMDLKDNSYSGEHWRASQHLVELREDKKNRFLSKIILLVNGAESITYRDVHRLDTLSQVTGLPHHDKNTRYIQAAAMILRVCAPDLYTALRNGDAKKADRIKAYFSTDSNRRDLKLTYSLLRTQILHRFNEYVPEDLLKSLDHPDPPDPFDPRDPLSPSNLPGYDVDAPFDSSVFDKMDAFEVP